MLNLLELSKRDQQHEQLTVSQRLPVFLNNPCTLSVDYRVETQDNFFLIHLLVKGDLSVTCQRCLNDFNLAYENATSIAVTRSDERAEQLLEQYECIVSSNWQVSLEDLVIDELHLYVPEFHQDTNDCNDEINHFLTESLDTY